MVDGEIISRSEAKARGLKLYFTGKPCSRGHIANRYICGGCYVCYTEDARKWRTVNRERKRENDRKWLLANSGRKQENNRKYYLANLDKFKEQRRKWRSENPEKRRDNTRKWKAENPEKYREIQHKRRAKQRGSSIEVVSKKQIDALLLRQKHKCAESTCKASIKKDRHLDHIIPLVLGGIHAISNFQYLCPPCNLRKGARHPITWANENGRLL